MKLDPQLERVLAARQVETSGQWQGASVALVREQAAQRKQREQFYQGPFATINERTIEGPGGALRLRVYDPSPKTPTLPALVYFHGGGWVSSDAASEDPPCHALACQADVRIVSVDYRLAPEHRYPAALEDARAALSWVIAHAQDLGIDPTRIAVGGCSAGGHLATTLALKWRDLCRAGKQAPALVYQLLIYPVIDPTLSTTAHRQTHAGSQYPGVLSSDKMAWYWQQYAPNAQAQLDDPYLVPLNAPDLSALPPALVVTAACDPLRDEGEAYAQRLQDANVPAQSLRYDAVTHGFYLLGGAVEAADQAIAASAAALRAALYDPQGTA